VGVLKGKLPAESRGEGVTVEIERTAGAPTKEKILTKPLKPCNLEKSGQEGTNIRARTKH